ncbi:MAG: calcium/sodium antiporter [Patescibacteria group bacterium]|nr:calcium/sodium antiporter [Patescibacteria group bacterium]
MLEIVLWIAVFVISLTVLLKASDLFTDSAEEIGLFFKLPAFIIGVTIVAFGTSLPEFVSSVFAVLGGSSEIVVGTVTGSNIANIFLILGIVAIVGKKMRLNFEILNVDLPILAASAFLMAVMAYDGKFTTAEAILSLIGLFIYLFRTIAVDEKIPKREQKNVEADIKRTLELGRLSNFPFKSFLMLLLGIGFIIMSAKYTIASAIELSKLFNIGKEIVGASIIAFGTSLPELAVSFAAVRRGKIEIAVGNVLGSNIFNTLGVMGVAGLFGTLVIPASILIFSLPVMLIATMLYFFVTQDKEITNWEGGFLLLFYVLYIGKLFNFI